MIGFSSNCIPQWYCIASFLCLYFLYVFPFSIENNAYCIVLCLYSLIFSHFPVKERKNVSHRFPFLPISSLEFGAKLSYFPKKENSLGIANTLKLAWDRISCIYCLPLGDSASTQGDLWFAIQIFFLMINNY